MYTHVASDHSAVAERTVAHFIASPHLQQYSFIAVMIFLVLLLLLLAQVTYNQARPLLINYLAS